VFSFVPIPRFVAVASLDSAGTRIAAATLKFPYGSGHIDASGRRAFADVVEKAYPRRDYPNRGQLT
jgi:hypothetical protein